MMEMQRKDRQMSEEFAWEVVDKSEYAFLAMTAEDGTPYGVVVNAFREGPISISTVRWKDIRRTVCGSIRRFV